ncbi:MAG: type II secretion system secretin GspD [Myxococcota bacterium]|nr:type II secretion system secretin GspD [Myxococcota bacterium]
MIQETASRIALLLACCLALAWGAGPAGAQQSGSEGSTRVAGGAEPGRETVHLDFKNVELAVVIEMIARTTGKNFIYDDKVRGRVTIVSPSPVNVEQAYAVFESVLKVKGFTVISGPAGVMQIIPVREAKEANVEIVADDRESLKRDHFVTRLIPLHYIDAAGITSTIKPLVSKDASMVTYAPTNTIILTDTATNIRRLLTILREIDVETFKEELAVIKIEHADAGTLGDQLSEIYNTNGTGQAATSSTAARRARSNRRTRSSTPTATEPVATMGKVRIITDSRTNSLILLASRAKIKDIRELIRTLDVPVEGTGRIHVYYLRHADAEELAQTLNGLLTGQRQTGRSGAGGKANAPQALRAAVTALAEGIQLNADPATNSLVIQASKEAYETLREVIERLDIERPQVLVEALIMEVQVGDSLELGMNLGFELNKTINLALESAADGGLFGPVGLGMAGAGNFLGNFRYQPDCRGEEGCGTTIQAIMRATQSDSSANIVAAPHLLTSDNEEAEIQIGQNIPIITNRLNSATGNISGQTTSVSVERQDVGVTLRVTPQISEGDTLRLKIFQENTNIIDPLGGAIEEVGVTLAKRFIDNTLVVADGQTVVIGGLLSQQFDDTVTKTPFLGDIPVLGWLFKTKSKKLNKINLLVFLTPHIVRSPADMELQSIRKRRQFEERLGGEFLVSGDLQEGETRSSPNPARTVLREQAGRYPLSRMREIEEQRQRKVASLQAELENNQKPDSYIVNAGVFHDEEFAKEKLLLLLDRGYDGELRSAAADGVPLFELRIGPYETVRQAEKTAEVLSDAFGLSTGLMLVPGSRQTPHVDDTRGDEAMP